MARRIGFILFGIVLGCFTACSEQQPTYPRRYVQPDVLSNPTAQASGKALFQKHCVICHGKLDEGATPVASNLVPPAPDFWETRYATIDPGYLFWRISDGKNAEPFRSRGSVMPAFGSTFDDQEIWDLVAYIKTRSGRGD